MRMAAVAPTKPLPTTVTLIARLPGQDDPEAILRTRLER
jgi:hypothetical protein